MRLLFADAWRDRSCRSRKAWKSSLPLKAAYRWIVICGRGCPQWDLGPIEPEADGRELSLAALLHRGKIPDSPVARIELRANSLAKDIFELNT